MGSHETGLIDLPVDVLCLIGKCVASPFRQIDDVARDCAAIAMTAKALSPVSTSAWRDCASIAECWPNLDTVAMKRNCQAKRVNKTQLFSVARNGYRIAKSASVTLMMHELERMRIVGESCPISTDAAVYLLHLAWLPITTMNAQRFFPDRELSGCERTSAQTLRYRSVLRAPPKTTPCELTASAIRMMTEMKERDAYLKANGIIRKWGCKNFAKYDAIVQLRERCVLEGVPANIAAAAERQVQRHYGHHMSMTLLYEEIRQLTIIFKAFDLETVSLAESGGMMASACYTICCTLQVRIIGKMMFAWDQGSATLEKVTFFYDSLKLASECMAVASKESLASASEASRVFNHIVSLHDMEYYVDHLAMLNRNDQDKSDMVALCDLLGAPFPIAVAAVQMLEEGYEYFDVMEDLKNACRAAYLHVPDFGNIEVGLLEPSTVLAVCDGARNTYFRGTVAEGMEFGEAPLTLCELDEYLGHMRLVRDALPTLDDEITRQCTTCDLRNQGQLLLRWKDVMNSLDLTTLREVCDKFHWARCPEINYAVELIEDFVWLVESTDLVDTELVPLINDIFTIRDQFEEAGVFKLEDMSSDNVNCCQLLHLFLARNDNFMANCTRILPDWKHYRLRSTLTLYQVPRMLRQLLVCGPLKFQELNNVYTEGESLERVENMMTKKTFAKVVERALGSEGTVWLDKAAPRGMYSDVYRRLKTYIIVNGGGGLPDFLKPVFAYMSPS
jgi:hypothetical protein